MKTTYVLHATACMTPFFLSPFPTVERHTSLPILPPPAFILLYFYLPPTLQFETYPSPPISTPPPTLTHPPSPLPTASLSPLPPSSFQPSLLNAHFLRPPLSPHCPPQNTVLAHAHLFFLPPPPTSPPSFYDSSPPRSTPGPLSPRPNSSLPALTPQLHYRSPFPTQHLTLARPLLHPSPHYLFISFLSGPSPTSLAFLLHECVPSPNPLIPVPGQGR